MDEVEAQRIYESISEEEIEVLKHKKMKYYHEGIKNNSLTLKEQAFLFINDPMRNAIKENPAFWELVNKPIIQIPSIETENPVPNTTQHFSNFDGALASMQEGKKEQEKIEESKFASMYKVALWTLISTIAGVSIGVVALVVALIK